MGTASTSRLTKLNRTPRTPASWSSASSDSADAGPDRGDPARHAGRGPQRVDHGPVVGAVAGGLDDDVAGETEVVAQREQLVLRGVARGVLALGGEGELGRGTEDVAVGVDRPLGHPEGRGARVLVPVQPARGLLEGLAHAQSSYRRPSSASGSRIPYMSRPSSPARNRCRLSSSVASRLAEASRHLGGPFPRHDDDAVDVGEHDVPGADQGVGADHRDVDRAERRLDRALGVDRAGEDREVHLLEVGDVAHAAVDDQPDRPPGPERGGEQLAEEAVLALGGARGDDDVAVTHLLGGDVQHPVVAGLEQDGDRGAAEPGAAVDRPDVRPHQPDPPHRLVDGGDAEARQGLHRGRRRRG